jgi:predicted transcriptional regulator
MEMARAVFLIDRIPLTYITTKYERCSMTGGESGFEDSMERQPTGEDRVRMVARQVSEPRTANWIASEADWSHGPTKRVLERLVDDGILHRNDTGAHTTYFPDYRRQAITEAIRLQDSDHTAEGLTERLTDLKAQISDWEDEFDVESPNQLRGTLVDETLEADEEDRRREIAREWEHLQRRIEIVGFAVREWDFLAPTTDR